MTWIDVKIPYEPECQLAHAYNRAMETTTAPWVLLLDQDIFFCNPNWYQMCLDVIGQLQESRVGLITCVTNGIHRANKTTQKAERIVRSDCIEKHVEVAKYLYRKYKTQVRKIDWRKITGFFMLIKKEVWKEIKFQDQGAGLGYVDWDFSTRLLRAGYEIYLVPGLYVYHRRGLRGVWKERRRV